jgi:hypothetical protein
MEILRNTPGSRQNSLKLTQLLADPGASSLRRSLMEPAKRQEKEELDKPAKTLSDVIQLQNCNTHSSTGF